jgi:hypothetical protein
MYLMYVDESGDVGLHNSPSRYFVITGMVVHELRWQGYLDTLITLRRQFRQAYKLRLRDEFHAAAFISNPGNLVKIKRHHRLAMIHTFARTLATMTDLNLINVVVDKQGKSQGYDVFGMAWKVLIQRFENTISRHNFPGPANPDERGIILCDHTDDKKLMALLRQMRRYNPVPFQQSFSVGHRNLPLFYIIEDPSFRDSAHSYFVQAVDLAAFLLYQKLAPNAYMRKKSAHNYFQLLQPILCSHASTKDPDGIVFL